MSLKSIISTVCMLSILFVNVPVSKASDILPGALIKGESFDSVYFLDSNGSRHAFPNASVYKSWYGDDFSNVIVVSDNELSDIQLGKNVTYRPGSTMVKITTVNTTYALDGRTIRPISTEEVAKGIFGSEWNTMIRDVPDVFFTNYQIGEAIDSVDDFDPISVIKNYLTLSDLFVSSIDKVVSNGVSNEAETSIVDELQNEIQELHNQIVELTPKTVVAPPCEIKTTFYPDLYADPLMESAYAWYSTSTDPYVFNVPVNASGTFGELEFRTGVSNIATIEPSLDQWTHRSSIRIQGEAMRINTDILGTKHYRYTCSNENGTTVSDVTINIVSN